MVSDLLRAGDDDRGARRHAAWALLVLALVAVIVAVLMVFVLGTSHEPKSRGPVAGGGPTSPSSPTAGSPTGSPTNSASASGSASPSVTDPSTVALPSPGDTVHPCPSSAACIVAGDVGGAVAAITALRAAHNLPPVTGSVSVAAQQCALQQGDGPNCAPHYAWQPVPQPDGSLVVARVSSDWLLDPKMTAFQVGWAYLPARTGTGGQWSCAVLKFS